VLGVLVCAAFTCVELLCSQGWCWCFGFGLGLAAVEAAARAARETATELDLIHIIEQI
jgi:hypothetical protein